MVPGKLATLIRLHRWRLDEERRGLAAALRELALRESALRALEAEIASQQESARAAPEAAGIDYGSYARLAVQRRASSRDAIATAEAEVSRRREQVQSRYRDLRTFERAEASRCRRAAAEASRRDRIALDEIALLTRAPGAARPFGVGATPKPPSARRHRVSVRQGPDLTACPRLVGFASRTDILLVERNTRWYIPALRGLAIQKPGVAAGS